MENGRDKLLQEVRRELLGTFVLVLLGCGSAVIAGTQIGYHGISFAFGLSLLAISTQSAAFQAVT